ncbi:MAG: hypothetical protein VKS61_02080, partial [Candidatus Sericytochromatia bacterium]|nr:hypothetical protein [Candidatus Sericytochromatia bacterium]
PVRPIGVRDVARVGVAYSGATTGRPEADIFASASLTAAGVTLDVPASCPLQVYVEDGLGAGWRESITVTAPADGGGVSTLP